MNSSIKTTLVITTYNQPDYLELALRCALKQTRLPDEIVVADDGSTEETADVMRAFGRYAPIPIVHAWQKDDGFRLNPSRNNALAVSTGDYVVLIDGDCFLSPHFIADHLYFAKPGRFVAGTRVHIQSKLKQKILATQNTRITFFTVGTSKKFNAIRSRFLANALSRPQPEKGPKAEEAAEPYWRGGLAGSNIAFWRADALRVNGFNEAFNRYGGDDVEFAARLEKAGVERFRMAHYGAAYHFAHLRSYLSKPEERLRPDSDAYLTSVEDCGRRCKDEFGLTRALTAVGGARGWEKGYSRVVF